jgi:hypothetical protein
LVLAEPEVHFLPRGPPPVTPFESSGALSSCIRRRSAGDSAASAALEFYSKPGKGGEIDWNLLAELRRYDDHEHGIAEEFLTQRLGRTRAIGVLTRPLADPLSEAWVICPSLGSEQASLRRLEAVVARTLAAAGLSTLRIRHDAQRLRELSLSARLSEAEDAVALLSGKLSVARIGLAGALFGGTVAALLCERLELAALALWEPVERGDRYLRTALRFQHIARLAEGPAGLKPERSDSASDELARHGFTVVRGFRLSDEDRQEIEAVDLTRDVRRYHGRSLLLGVSANGAPSPSLRRLSEHLAALGGELRVEVVQDSLATPFGEHYYRNVGVARIDTRLALDQKLADVTAVWASKTGDMAREKAT